jgi:outer membrane protein TolC
MSMFAPASFASNQVQPGYVLGASQKIPWAGKRSLRGQVARAEASSAYMDFQDLRLQLIEATQLAFLDYYLAHRELELNAANREQLRRFRETARDKYESASAPQQDMLQADVELAELERRQIELERGGRIALARINTLLHLAPDAPLPPPPPRLQTGAVLASVRQLREMAVARRPDLAALGAKVRAARASLALTYRDFYPDLELYGRYDSFWQPSSQRDLRAQVGMNLNVPIYKDRRRAAASEAMYRLRQQQAEYEQRVDDIHREVQAAYEQFDGSQRIVQLYAKQLLPAAERNVESARADYEAGQADFLRLVAAERQLIMLQERQQETIVEYYRNRAQLERAMGSPLLTAPAGRLPADP